MRLSGYAALPTLNRASAQHQYLFVNGRPVRDRLLLGAVRAAYADHLHRGRHPMAALFVALAPDLVDVNVHPTKAEVRFRDAGRVRGLIVGALKRALAAAGHHAATTVADEALAGPHAGGAGNVTAAGGRAAAGRHALPRPRPRRRSIARRPASPRRPRRRGRGLSSASRAQVHGTYRGDRGIVIVDQHAAHERVYDADEGRARVPAVSARSCLIPEVELDDAAASRGWRRGPASSPTSAWCWSASAPGARGAGAHRRRRHAAWCATWPTSSRTGTRRRRCASASPTCAARWPATAASAPAAGSTPTR